MTDLRGERVDEGKVWAACPTYVNELSTCVKLTLGGPMDSIEMARLAEAVRLGVDRLVDENASLRAEVERLTRECDNLRGQIEDYTTVGDVERQEYQDRIRQLEEVIRDALEYPTIHDGYKRILRRVGRE